VYSDKEALSQIQDFNAFEKDWAYTPDYLDKIKKNGLIGFEIEVVEQSLFSEMKEFTLFFQADARQQSVEVLGFLRNYFIKDLDLLAGKEQELAFAFVTDFPLYEVDPETGDFASAHHPFTKPKLKDIPFVISLGQKVLQG
jgi:aspartyl-tRNA synthetase